MSSSSLPLLPSLPSLFQQPAPPSLQPLSTLQSLPILPSLPSLPPPRIPISSSAKLSSSTTSSSSSKPSKSKKNANASRASAKSSSSSSMSRDETKDDKNHVKREKKRDSKLENCIYCGKTGFVNLKQHHTGCQPYLKNYRCPLNFNPIGQRCVYFAAQKDQFDKHLNIHAQIKFYCPAYVYGCKFKTTNINMYNEHVILYHFMEFFMTECGTCGYVWKPDLSKHLKEQIKEKATLIHSLKKTMSSSTSSTKSKRSKGDSNDGNDGNDDDDEEDYSRQHPVLYSCPETNQLWKSKRDWKAHLRLNGHGLCLQRREEILGGIHGIPGSDLIVYSLPQFKPNSTKNTDEGEDEEEQDEDEAKGRRIRSSSKSSSKQPKMKSKVKKGKLKAYPARSQFYKKLIPPVPVSISHNEIKSDSKNQTMIELGSIMHDVVNINHDGKGKEDENKQVIHQLTKDVFGGKYDEENYPILEHHHDKPVRLPGWIKKDGYWFHPRISKINQGYIKTFRKSLEKRIHERNIVIGEMEVLLKSVLNIKQKSADIQSQLQDAVRKGKKLHSEPFLGLHDIVKLSETFMKKEEEEGDNDDDKNGDDDFKVKKEDVKVKQEEVDHQPSTSDGSRVESKNSKPLSQSKRINFPFAVKDKLGRLVMDTNLMYLGRLQRTNVLVPNNTKHAYRMRMESFKQFPQDLQRVKHHMQLFLDPDVSTS